MSAHPPVDPPTSRGIGSPLLALLRGLRPRQWAKNVLLFVALVFARHVFEPFYVLHAMMGFALFCTLSSVGYLFNDLRDVEADRGHPKKRHRPLASGELPVGLAQAFMVLGGPGALAVSFWLAPAFGWTALAYLTLTLSYTLWIKHIVIVDVMALAALFILRAVAGAAAIGVPVSPWFLTCIAFGSLFLAMNKRLAELKLLEGSAGKHRKNLEEYSPELLERMTSVVTACAVMSYALYTFDLGTPHTRPRWLMLSIPFVLYGIFRYQYLVARKGEGGAPEQTLFTDRPLQINILLYGMTVLIVLYLG